MARRRDTRRGLYTGEGRRKYLNAEERRRFLIAADQAPAEERALCMMLAHLGLRISESLALTARDIQLSDGIVAVRCLKKRGRVVIRELLAPPVLIEGLENTFGIADRQSDPALADARLWPWSRVTAWRVTRRVLRMAGINGSQAMPKGLRHGFGVHAIQRGVPLVLIQRWLGHADIATTAIYTHVLGPEERSIAKRMW